MSVFCRPPAAVGLWPGLVLSCDTKPRQRARLPKDVLSVCHESVFGVGTRRGDAITVKCATLVEKSIFVWGACGELGRSSSEDFISIEVQQTASRRFRLNL